MISFLNPPTPQWLPNKLEMKPELAFTVPCDASLALPLASLAASHPRLRLLTPPPRVSPAFRTAHSSPGSVSPHLALLGALSLRSFPHTPRQHFCHFILRGVPERTWSLTEVPLFALLLPLLSPHCAGPKGRSGAVPSSPPRPGRVGTYRGSSGGLRILCFLNAWKSL